MSYKEWVESGFKDKIKLRLSERGDTHGRLWLNPAKYESSICIDNSLFLEPIREEKIIYPIHSYEIFDFSEDQVDDIIDKICNKIEIAFVDIISSKDLSKKISFVEGDLEIKLEYRVALITIKYNIAEW